MRGFFLVMKAEIVRSFIIMRRYWFATVISMIFGYMTLIGIAYGLMYNRELVRETVEKQMIMAQSMTSGILGFLLGMFAFSIVGMFTQGLQGMAQTGELEQLCLSPHGLVTNFLARSFVGAVNMMINMGVLLAFVAYTLEGQLAFAPVETLAVLGLTYCNLIGFGFMVGGLILVFKQTGQIATLVRLGLMGLAILGTNEFIADRSAPVQFFVHMIPITDAAACLKYVLVDAQAAGSVFQSANFWWLLVNATVWTGIGIFVFKWMENLSRYKGTLGAY
ncbi:MAG: hypothetical protein KJ052_04365 [Candidatus Hydrogenedentes bacterium]|nr:hypothetical protein [Candidatus Hydrogenedentota bacterium]